MATLGMDLWCVSLGKPCANQHKSIPLVTIFLLKGSPWRILYILYIQTANGHVSQLLCKLCTIQYKSLNICVTNSHALVVTV